MNRFALEEDHSGYSWEEELEKNESESTFVGDNEENGLISQTHCL